MIEIFLGPLTLIFESYSGGGRLAYYFRVGMWEAWAEFDLVRGGLGFSTERNEWGEATLYAGRLMVQWNRVGDRPRTEGTLGSGQPPEHRAHAGEHPANLGLALPWHQRDAALTEPARSWLHRLKFPRGLSPSLRAMRPKTHTA